MARANAYLVNGVSSRNDIDEVLALAAPEGVVILLRVKPEYRVTLSIRSCACQRSEKQGVMMSVSLVCVKSWRGLHLLLTHSGVSPWSASELNLTWQQDMNTK